MCLFKEALLKSKDFDERMDLFFSLIPPETRNKQKLEKQAGVAVYNRLKAALNYTFKNKNIKSTVHLFKAKYPMVDEEDDYQLSKVCDNIAQVITIDGDHVSILNNPNLVKAVSKVVQLKS